MREEIVLALQLAGGVPRKAQRRVVAAHAAAVVAHPHQLAAAVLQRRPRCAVAPASSAFSTSSFTTAAGRSIDLAGGDLVRERRVEQVDARHGANTSRAWRLRPRLRQAEIRRQRTAAGLAALGAHDRFQVAVGALQIVVDHPVLVTGGAGEADLDLRRRGAGGARWRRRRWTGPRAAAPARRARAAGSAPGPPPGAFLDRLAALHVDVEHHQGGVGVDGAARRAVLVPVRRAPIRRSRRGRSSPGTFPR